MNCQAGSEATLVFNGGRRKARSRRIDGTALTSLGSSWEAPAKRVDREQPAVQDGQGVARVSLCADKTVSECRPQKSRGQALNGQKNLLKIAACKTNRGQGD